MDFFLLLSLRQACLKRKADLFSSSNLMTQHCIYFQANTDVLLLLSSLIKFENFLMVKKKKKNSIVIACQA